MFKHIRYWWHRISFAQKWYYTLSHDGCDEPWYISTPLPREGCQGAAKWVRKGDNINIYYNPNLSHREQDVPEKWVD